MLVGETGAYIHVVLAWLLWATMGRFPSIDMVLDCMGIIRSIHLYGKRYRRIFFTIDYEGVIIIPIDLLRRELARALRPITFQS